jgi:hypothetical protein
VTLRARARGKEPQIALPALPQTARPQRSVELIDTTGGKIVARALDRSALHASGDGYGPILLLDDEATSYVPPNWHAEARADGTVVLSRTAR